MNAAYFPARLATVLVALTLPSFANAKEPAATPKPPPDGVKQTFNEKGKLIAEDTYLNGVLHGPSKKWDGRGTLLVEGAYKNGKMDGLWRELNGPEWTAEKNYRDGVLHGSFRTRWGTRISNDGQYIDGVRDGKWMKTSSFGKTINSVTQFFRRGVRDDTWIYTSNQLPEPIRLMFKNGDLMDSPAELKDLPLLKRVKLLSGPNVPPDLLMERLVDSLFEQVDLEYTETPVKETTHDLVERFVIPICLDGRDLERNKRTLEAPVTIKYYGVPLILGLARIARLHGLTLDYRYHGIWLTRRDTADNWKGDPTGAMTLAPPKGSVLEKVLEQASKTRHEKPNPKDLLTAFEEQGIKLEISEVAATRQLRDHAQGVRYYSPGLTAREMLAVTLYQSGCACIEKNGALVIVPQTPVQ